MLLFGNQTLMCGPIKKKTKHSPPQAIVEGGYCILLLPFCRRLVYPKTIEHLQR